MRDLLQKQCIDLCMGIEKNLLGGLETQEFRCFRGSRYKNGQGAIGYFNKLFQMARRLQIRKAVAGN